MSDAMFERLEGLGAMGGGRRPKQAGDGGERERVRRDSFAGPNLPVRFSRISIASNQDSKDPWSQRSEDSCDSSGHVAAPSPLTSSDFRQRADKDRSFTGSAPPGVRPPTKGGAGLFGAPTNDEDEIDCDEPRRDSGSAPVTRPPPSVRARPLGGFACTPRPHCLRAHSQHSHRDSTVSIPSPKTNPRLCFHTHPPPLPPPAPRTCPPSPPLSRTPPFCTPRICISLSYPSTSSPHPHPEPPRAPQHKAQRAELRR